jgi:hypothetical protein
VATAASSTTTSGVSDFLLELFFTARLRGDFGSIAMAPNPLCVCINALWLEFSSKSSVVNSR